MMESMMAGLAASRRNPETERALRESLALTKVAVDSGDYQKYLDEVSNFRRHHSRDCPAIGCWISSAAH